MNGPALDMVEDFCRRYNGESFDSMQDLATSIIRYRTESGEIVQAVKAPADAVARVMFGNSYVFCNRYISESFGRKLAPLLANTGV